MKLNLDSGKLVLYSSRVLSAGYIVMGSLIASGKVGNIDPNLGYIAGGALAINAGIVSLISNKKGTTFDVEETPKIKTK